MILVIEYAELKYVVVIIIHKIFFLGYLKSQYQIIYFKLCSIFSFAFCSVSVLFLLESERREYANVIDDITPFISKLISKSENI